MAMIGVRGLQMGVLEVTKNKKPVCRPVFYCINSEPLNDL